MKISRQTSGARVRLDTLAPGSVFRWKGRVYMVIFDTVDMPEGKVKAVTVREGQLERFSMPCTVTQLKAKVVLE